MHKSNLVDKHKHCQKITFLHTSFEVLRGSYKALLKEWLWNAPPAMARTYHEPQILECRTYQRATLRRVGRGWRLPFPLNYSSFLNFFLLSNNSTDNDFENRVLKLGLDWLFLVSLCVLGYCWMSEWVNIWQNKWLNDWVRIFFRGH